MEKFQYFPTPMRNLACLLESMQEKKTGSKEPV
jgi:hypothetical protein